MLRRLRTQTFLCGAGEFPAANFRFGAIGRREASTMTGRAQNAGEFPANFRDLRRTMTARAQNAQRDAAVMVRNSSARALQRRAAAPNSTPPTVVEMSTEQAERRFFEVQARALGSQPSSDRKRAVAAAALWLAQARAASGGR
jgi:hypothetical protein